MKKSLCLLAAALFVGCVDRSVDLAEVELNVGINADNLVIPLGYINDMKIGDALGEQIDNLNVDPQTGEYSLSYGVENQQIVIDGSGNSFVLPATTFETKVEYPSFNLDNAGTEINQKCYVGATLNGVEITSGQINNFIEGAEVSAVQDGKTGFTVDVHVPEYVERIDRVYIKHDANLPGAPLVATFDLGCLSEVNGGGVVRVTLDIPEDYEVYDEHFNLVKDNHVHFDDHYFAAGEHSVSFVMYIGSIANHHAAEDGEIHLPGEMEYHVSYEMKTKKGLITVDNIPSLTLQSHLVCDDAEIILSDMDLLPLTTFENEIEVDSFNDSVKSVKSLNLANTNIRLFVDGMNWWSEDAIMAGALDDIFVELNFPKSFVLEPIDSKIAFNKQTNTLHATLAQLQGGITMSLQKIDFGEQGVAPAANGKIKVALPISMRVALEHGARIRLHYLQHEGDVVVNAGYRETRLIVSSVTGRVDFSHEESLSLELAEFAGGSGIEIKGLGVNPVIDFSLSNSLTLPLYVNASLVPVRNGVEDMDDKVTIDSFEVHAATLGENFATIVPALTKVRIGSGLADEQGVTVINSDLEKLFNGALPEALNIHLSVATDPEQDVSLTIVPSYPITYGYNFFMPLSFGSALDLNYSGEAEDIGKSIGELDLDLSATGEVALICEVENTTPFNLAINFQMLDENGNPTPIQIQSGEDNQIKGSTDGVTPCKSTVKLRLKSGSADLLEGLSSVANLRYNLHVTSATDGVALNKNQTISVNILMEVDGNLNINLNE